MIFLPLQDGANENEMLKSSLETCTNLVRTGFGVFLGLIGGRASVSNNGQGV